MTQRRLKQSLRTIVLTTVMTALAISARGVETPPAAEGSPAAAPARPAAPFAEGREAVPRSAERQREGTKLIDQVGTFEFLGDRATFVPAGSKDSFRVLENLALERISRQQVDTRGQQEWTISGVLTEFKGANYLLITKAVARHPR
jgi:hypothetical protein